MRNTAVSNSWRHAGESSLSPTTKSFSLPRCCLGRDNRKWCDAHGSQTTSIKLEKKMRNGGPFGAVFSLSMLQYGITERIAETEPQVKTRRRPSKADRKKKRFNGYWFHFYWLFATFKNRYRNLISLLVGSLASGNIWHLLYLFFFKWIRKQEGLLSGFFTLLCFAGLLLIFEASWFGNMVWTSRSKRNHGTVVTDLTGFRTTSFGGGLIEFALYMPTLLSLFKYRHLLYWFYLDLQQRRSPNQSLNYILRYCPEFFSRSFLLNMAGGHESKRERFCQTRKNSPKAREG